MEQVTADQVKSYVQERGITRWKLRECSMCGYPLSYLFDGTHVTYDAGCDCVRYNAIEQRTYGDIAATLNMQTPEIRARMWAELGAVREASK